MLFCIISLCFDFIVSYAALFHNGSIRMIRIIRQTIVPYGDFSPVIFEGDE
jgi:hypothetical protein